MPKSNFPENKMSSTVQPLSEHVIDRQLDSCRVLSLKTPVDAVVSWEGSFRTYPDLESGDGLLQTLVVSLLDKGTRSHDRFVLADLLDNKGAQVHFSSDGLFVAISGKALNEDIQEILPLVVEQLVEPLFDPDEIEKARARIAATIQRSMENTASQAAGALTRQLYTPAHPNYIRSADEQLELLFSYTPEDVRNYHEQHFGAHDLTMVFVGDLDNDGITQVVEKNLGQWPVTRAPQDCEIKARPNQPGRTEVFIPDKNNIDVRMGQSLSMLRDDDNFIPFYLGNYILGGNFSARLMMVVRDELGLTYGIRSGLSGLAVDHEGHWQISCSLSEEHVEKGISAISEVVNKFVEEGITEEELDDKKTTVNGRYIVGLATTGGMASALLHNTERGFGTEYLDLYPELIEATTRRKVNDVIQSHCKPTQFHIALAGSIK